MRRVSMAFEFSDKEWECFQKVCEIRKTEVTYGNMLKTIRDLAVEGGKRELVIFEMIQKEAEKW